MGCALIGLSARKITRVRRIIQTTPAPPLEKEGTLCRHYIQIYNIYVYGILCMLSLHLYCVSLPFTKEFKDSLLPLLIIPITPYLIICPLTSYNFT